MSQVETNPLLNPTITETKPTQILQTLPSGTVTDFKRDDKSLIRTQGKIFSSPQLDWVKLAQKNKWIFTYRWPVNDSSIWMNYHVRIRDILNAVPIGTSFNAFGNFNTIKFSIKPTNNAYFKGCSILYWLPAPNSAFFSTFYSIANGNLSKLWQLPHALISPKTSEQIDIYIPFNYPFEFFRTQQLGNTLQSVLSTYQLDYTLGFIRARPIVNLETTGTLTGLDFNVSIEVLDFETAGTNVTAYH
jgi:hypothetical protein